jgi:phosphatidylserine decarboxylase
MSALKDLIIKEGWRPVGLTVGLALLFALFGFKLLSLLALGAAAALVIASRNPVHSVSHFEKGSLTAPCDGTVRAIETEADGTVVVEIETGCLNASVLTMPLEGEVVSFSLMRGARLPRKSPLFEQLNEKATMTLQSISGQTVTLNHSLYRAAAPLVMDIKESGKKFGRGARYGVLLQGAVRLELPASTRVAVNAGEKVTATETLLGYMGNT